MKTPIYLDYAAATPLDNRVKAAMEPYWQDKFYNPSALYLASKAVAADMAAARARIAGHLGCRPAELVFTAGGTEANNLAISGVMRQFPEATLVVSAIEHEAVLEPAGQYRSKRCPVKSDGRIDIAALKQLVDDQTVLVSVMYANNEIGTIEPLKEVARLLADIRKDRRQRQVTLPLYLHTDACQAANYLDLHVARLGVDMLTLNAGKIYGPKQCGTLYVKTGVRFQPQILGGGQERGQRSGTENTANIIGFATALDLVQADRHAETDRLIALRQQFIEHLTLALPTAIINGSLDHRLPNNLHVTFPGQDNERLLMQLDEQGIMCAAGSACTASSAEPSHVLRAIGLTDKEAQASLRFTMGRGTTADDVRRVVDTLTTLITA